MPNDGKHWQPGHHGPLTRHSLLTAFAHHIGKQRGIKGSDMVELIMDGPSDPASERHLRDLVQDLREEGHHICGHPRTGYFIAANEQELNETCEFLYKRSIGTLHLIARMKNVSLPDLRGQLRLPT